MAKYIYLDDILQKQIPKYYKLTPKFLINLLKKIIHQDQINAIIKQYENDYGEKFIYDVLKAFKTKIDYKFIDRVPKKKRLLFVANHPLGALDGVAFIHLVFRFFGDVKAVVNELLLYLENLAPVFEGVNVFGGFNREQNKRLEQLYESDKHIIIFPSGTVSRKIKGKIQDVQWQKSFIAKAIKFQRDIVPVYIDGRNTNFFYNFANFRKFTGVKFPVELIFLPDQMFKYENKTITFVFGDLIPYETLKESGKNFEELKKMVREKVYDLKNEIKKSGAE